MWLMYNHALPVKSRYYGEKEDHTCISCGKEETIPHIMSHCKRTKRILKLTLKECALRGWHSGKLPKDNKIWFIDWNKGWNDILTQTATNIAAHHIWTSRNKFIYEQVNPPPIKVIVNNIWLELENSIKAKID